MQKKSIINKLSTTVLILSTLVISGCSHSPSATPVSTIQKNFTNDFDVEVLKNAITAAAEKNDWNIVDPTSQSINLKKTYTTKKREISSLRTKRWYKPAVKHEIYVNVDVNKKFFKIEPSKGYEESFKSDRQREKFNQELANLEDAIYLELVPHLL